MTDIDEAATPIEGRRDITWRPGAFPPQSCSFTLTRDNDSIVARIETLTGTSIGEGIVEGRIISWTVTVAPNPAPMRFEAEIEGDVLLGHVEARKRGRGDIFVEGSCPN